MQKTEQKKIIEAILFLSEEPVKAGKIAAVLAVSSEETNNLLIELVEDFKKAARGIQVIETAAGFQMGTLPELAPHLERAFSEDVSSNLSTAALEALAIIAYKQPVTRIEIESIRGVRSEHVLENLVGMYGMMTGTISTGMALLREVDPNFETGASKNFVLGSGVGLIFGFPLMILLTVPILGFVQNNPMYYLLTLILFTIYLGFLFLLLYLNRPKADKT